VLLEGLGQLKNPMTSSGIDPALFNTPHPYFAFSRMQQDFVSAEVTEAFTVH
jgi:hypothetical protein